MKRCMVCCKPLGEKEEGYHPRCAVGLFGVRSAPRLTFTWDELNAIAEKTIRRSVAVPGVQPKLSVHLERACGNGPDRFTLVGLEGEMILKPPSPKYPEMPELEHACMILASRAGIETAVCGLASMASVAPSVEANETSAVPSHRGNNAPPSRVRIAAPGIDRAETTT